MSISSPPSLWAHVQALGVIAQCGSYTQAAQRLGLSKAAVSHRIAELERAVGVPLLTRTTRSVRLTTRPLDSSSSFQWLTAASCSTEMLASAKPTSPWR